jgi:hypothetical protein
MSNVNDNIATAGVNAGQSGNTPEPTVNTPAVDNTEPKSLEQIAREKENLHNALIEARNEKKELAKKLAEIEQQDKARREKELAEQGKYQELLATKEQEFATVKQQLEALSSEVATYREYEAKKLDTLKNKIKESNLSPAQIEIIESALNGKSTSEQIDLIPKFINTFVGSSANSLPNNQQNGANVNVGLASEYEDAKKKGDIAKMLELKMKMEG